MIKLQHLIYQYSKKSPEVLKGINLEIKKDKIKNEKRVDICKYILYDYIRWVTQTSFPTALC